MSLNDKQKNILLKIARESLEIYVSKGEILDFMIDDERLEAKEGAFVTLREYEKLRGCVGRIISDKKPLWEVVRDMAIASGTEDPRFSPVGTKDLDLLNYEISVLSVPEKCDDWHNIELGRHGVIISKEIYSGVFLPQVAIETGWSLEEFLSRLCSQKAGLAPNAYKNDPDVELKIFTAQVFKE
ncbi:AmmeMemoRadiSam system protein A [Candidatus Parcubacteria bacterium]|nr:AmmeMemoRadiSam system protein A [Candidatus Parcubacteria bacterium]